MPLMSATLIVPGAADRRSGARWLAWQLHSGSKWGTMRNCRYPPIFASIPHGTYAECFDQDRDPIFWGLFKNHPVIANGMYALPEGPGFGLELDTDFIERYRVGTFMTPS